MPDRYNLQPDRREPDTSVYRGASGSHAERQIRQMHPPTPPPQPHIISRNSRRFLADRHGSNRNNEREKHAPANRNANRSKSRSAPVASPPLPPCPVSPPVLLGAAHPPPAPLSKRNAAQHPVTSSEHAADAGSPPASSLNKQRQEIAQPPRIATPNRRRRTREKKNKQRHAASLNATRSKRPCPPPPPLSLA